MDSTDYWLFACKFCIWNAWVAALQFWTEDLDHRHSAVLLRGCTQPSSTWLCPAPVTCWTRSSIWSLCDHIKWCLQRSTRIRRYWIQKWEQKYECSHSIMLRTRTISHFHTRKIYLSDLPPQEHAHLTATPMQCVTDWLMKKTIHPHSW